MNNKRITTPFGAQSTAMEVIEGVGLGGARAIVTGGSSGIGVETARALLSAGAEVTLAVRNVDADGARVVVVSSVGHINGEVIFDDVSFERHPYGPWVAYAQSKTANILFMIKASKR